LRREIEPVPLTRFAAFLFAWQHLTPATRASGRDGLRDVIRQLQGFELPAVAWERAVLPARVDGYEPRWLDECCLGGDVAWGRIAPRPGGGERTQAATRNVPIALMEREHAARLRRAAAPPSISPRARGVWDTLKTRGASFTQELAVAAHLLPAELDRALWELVAAGLVTQDGFAPIRALGAGTHRGRPRSRSAPRGHGRWSLTGEPLDDHPEQHWASLLLDRYGVVFRDLLAREHAAPPWYRLVPQFRAMETRGDIRGGRFVAQVGGEQYARPSAVEQLRRPVEPSTAPICVSAVDPANITALFPQGPRVRTHPANTVAFVNGTCLGIRQGSEQWIDEHAPEEVKQAVQAALRGSRQLGRTPR
ncbi:MAG: hypothetical protein ABIO65_07740, partial [Nitrospiria bacterium]